jgi:ankyrin repeat protein
MLLKDRGANLDAVNAKRGMTALMYAADCGHHLLVSYLLRSGAISSCVDHVSYLNKCHQYIV